MRFDTCYLVFPRNSLIWRLTGLAPASNVEQRVPLLLLPSLFAGGRATLIFSSGRILTKKEFLSLKSTSGVWIECQDPQRVAQALRLPSGDPGIKRISGRKAG